MLTTSENGGGLAVALEAARLGVGVLRPVVDGARYDLILDLGPRLLRVQCKHAVLHGDVVRVGLRTSRVTRARQVRTRYTADEIDAFGVYCAELKRCFLLPINRFDGSTYVHLRLAPTRNNQPIGVNLAADFDLAKMVRDLGL